MLSSTRLARWLVPVVLLVVWLGVGRSLGPYAGKLGEVSTNDQAAFLPQSAESTRVARAQGVPARRRPSRHRGLDGGRRRAGDPGAQAASARPLAELDGTALDRRLPLPRRSLARRQGDAGGGSAGPELGDELPAAVDEIREAGRPGRGHHVPRDGAGGHQADLSEAFAGIDGLLLGVALAAVLVILLLVYRSVLLPLLIIIGAVFALSLACAIVYALGERDLVRVDGQVQGILSILVIGAATDYALLLTARFREELGRTEDRYAAMRAALRQSVGPIVASAATVALGLLALFLSDLTNNRRSGPSARSGSSARWPVRSASCRPRWCCSDARPTGRPARGRRRRGQPAAGVWSGSRPWSAAPRAGVGRGPGGAARLRRLRADAARGAVPLDEIFVNEAPR